MNIQTNAPDRKALAQSLGAHLGVEIAYNGPPTFAYQVGDLLVERNGSISGPDDQVEGLRSHLEANGWLDREVEQVAIPVPAEGLTGTQLRNLIYSLHSKQYLLNRMLRRDVFSISDELVETIGSTECDQVDQLLAAIASAENAIKDAAFSELLHRVVENAKTATRINPAELKPENEKYYLRGWLIRLGFAGTDGKEVRRPCWRG